MKVKELDFNFGELLGRAEMQASRGWDINFVDDIGRRYENWGDELFVTEAQIKQLERIANAS